MEDSAMSIVGVLPAGFHFPQRPNSGSLCPGRTRVSTSGNYRSLALTAGRQRVRELPPGGPGLRPPQKSLLALGTSPTKTSRQHSSCLVLGGNPLVYERQRLTASDRKAKSDSCSTVCHSQRWMPTNYSVRSLGSTSPLRDDHAARRTWWRKRMWRSMPSSRAVAVM